MSIQPGLASLFVISLLIAPITLLLAQAFPGDPYNFFDNIEEAGTVSIYETYTSDSSWKLIEKMDWDSQSNIIRNNYYDKNKITELQYDGFWNKMKEKEWNYGKVDSTILCNFYENSKLTTISETNSLRIQNFFYDTCRKLIRYENLYPGRLGLRNPLLDRIFGGSRITWDNAWFGSISDVAFINFHYTRDALPDTSMLGFYMNGIDTTIITYRYRTNNTLKAATKAFSNGTSLEATFDIKGRIKTEFYKHKTSYHYDSHGRLKKVRKVLRSRIEGFKMVTVKNIPGLIKHNFTADRKYYLKRTVRYRFAYSHGS